MVASIVRPFSSDVVSSSSTFLMVRVRNSCSLPVSSSLAAPNLAWCATRTDAPFNSTAIRLDGARSSIQPSLGANKYEFTQPFIENVPQGENAPLNQVLQRAPSARAASIP